MSSYQGKYSVETEAEAVVEMKVQIDKLKYSPQNPSPDDDKL